MSREIKFRAWYKPLSIMVDPGALESINFEVKVVGAYIEFDGRGFHKLRSSDFELMQYTGLKDRNGKGIYEGDIVRCGDMPIYEAEVMYDDHLGAWGLCRDQVMSCYAGDYDEQDREVIGNIYENPSLLGDTGGDEE